MLSFHNDIAVKQKYLDRVMAHQKADNIIRGTGWSNGKGCAVGCTLENYDHSRYPIELGVPEWLAKIAKEKPAFCFVVVWPADGSMPTYHSNVGDMPTVLMRVNEFVHKHYNGDFSDQ